MLIFEYMYCYMDFISKVLMLPNSIQYVSYCDANFLKLNSLQTGKFCMFFFFCRLLIFQIQCF